MAFDVRCSLAATLLTLLLPTAVRSSRSSPLASAKVFLQASQFDSAPVRTSNGSAADDEDEMFLKMFNGASVQSKKGSAAAAINISGQVSSNVNSQVSPDNDALDLDLPLLPTVSFSATKADRHGPDEPDRYAWLEDVTGDRAISWVRMQNNRTISSIGSPKQSPMMPKVLNVLESKDKIPYVTAIDEFLYNLWTDDQHVRGLWRRTTMAEYQKEDPEWETVLDLDALGEAEGESWVWKSFVSLEEPGRPKELVLLQLSRGGADAVVVREFNLKSKSFVPPPQGFYVSESKTDVNYVDRNTLTVGTDTGKGSMTSSSYPRQVRFWKRGTPLEEAPVVFEGQDSDMHVYSYRQYERRDCVYEWRNRVLTFYSNEINLKIVKGPGASEDFVKLETPQDAGVSIFADQLLLSLRSEYRPVDGIVFPVGGLIATSLAGFVAGTRDRWTELFRPTENTTLKAFTATRDFVVLQLLDNVKGGLASWKYSEDGQWRKQSAHSAVQIESISTWAFDEKKSNAVWIQSQSFLSPPTLMLASSAADTSARRSIKSLPTQFDATGLVASQRWATSDDGTLIPYFLVKYVDAPANQPTLLYGYGGFEISQMPYYLSVMGPTWITKGGVFALANIRGGGEYGPDWHQAALKEHRHRSYEDFAAIAKDLSNDGITSPEKLGIMGGSNGGLLVGNMLVKYPELFGAVVCQVPLLDMWRYDKLLAGQSWTAEFGDPDDPEEWEFLRFNSPYHLINPEVSLPPALFVTSTRDDRVHPGHARKMVAKLQETQSTNSAKHTFLYENMEGGHGGAADSEQLAFVKTLEIEFLWQSLGSANHPVKSGATRFEVACTMSTLIVVLFAGLNLASQ